MYPKKGEGWGSGFFPAGRQALGLRRPIHDYVPMRANSLQTTLSRQLFIDFPGSCGPKSTQPASLEPAPPQLPTARTLCYAITRH
jgi:hypothetical protein